MNTTAISPIARELTQRLILCASDDTDAVTPAGFSACDKLRRPLNMLLGGLAYRALILRALTLARRESASLDSVKIKDDGSFDSINAEAMMGGAVLVQHLVGLLLSFVGEAITLRLLHDVWPDLPALNTTPGAHR